MKREILLSLIVFLLLVSISWSGEKVASTGVLPPLIDGSASVVIRTGIGSGEGQIALSGEGEAIPASEGPSAIVVDEKENVYILDLFNLRVLCYDEKGKLTGTVPVPAGENVRNLDYISDLVVTPEYFIYLNQSKKKLLYFSREGKFVREIDLSSFLALPKTMALSPAGILFVRDDEGKIAGIDREGKIIFSANGFDITEFANSEGFLYAWGEETDTTKDVLGIYPDEIKDASASSVNNDTAAVQVRKKSKVIARLVRALPEYELMDWKFIGTDAKGNFYVASTEKIAKETEEVQITVNRVSPDGKILSRMRTSPPPRIRCFPEREMIVSPAGDIWMLAGDEKYTEFRILRYRF